MTSKPRECRIVRIRRIRKANMSHLAVRNIHTEKKEEYKKILHNTSFYQNIVFGKKKNDKQHHQEDVWDLLTTTKIGAKKKRLRTSSIWVLVRIIEMLEYNEKNKKRELLHYSMFFCIHLSCIFTVNGIINNVSHNHCNHILLSLKHASSCCC